jgi:choline dehydrogenase-like flavoprotein
MQTVHPESGTRVSSASAYYLPNKSRKNLTVITHAHATKVTFKKNDAKGGLAEAEGVEFSQNGSLRTVKAKREVIVSSGAFQTPQVLELSGIGSRKILEDHGIPVVVDLPGVGSNLQDHIWFPLIVELDKNQSTFDDLTNPEKLKEEFEIYAKTKKGMLAESAVSGFVFAPVSLFTDKEKIMETVSKFDVDSLSGLSAGVRKGLEIQKEWIGRDDNPSLEIVFGQFLFPPPAPGQEGKKFFTMVVALMHPFARGSVHITSTDPLAKPAVDNCFLQNPIDIQICVENLKFARKICNAEPLNSIKVKEVVPGEAVQSDEQIEKYVRDSFQSVYHPMGTAAMLPREDGGVVDPELKVYGTKNLRVVDMSIFPIQIAAHPQSTLYAVAEKAADIIKAHK